MLTKEQLIEKLNLEKHPEGGFFKETYRSEISIPGSSLTSETTHPKKASGFDSDRSVSTCIYFMLTSDEFSAFHKVNQDEVWHFYLGHPITLHMISTEGDYSKINIGNDFTADETPQFIVPAHYWFAAEVEEKNAFALVGCTVAPGFDFEDFELAERRQLQNEFPEHSKVIQRLTR